MAEVITFMIIFAYAWFYWKRCPKSFDDTKDHWLDIFMVVKAGEARLHFRDNGKPFDPIAYSDTHEVGIGLKLIRGMAQEIAYSHNLILNELYVRL